MTKNLDNPASHPIHKLFRYPKLKKNWRITQRKISAVRQKMFDGNSWYPSPLLSINLFATGNFLKRSTEGLLYEILRNCETKYFLHKILILAPSVLSINFFATENFLKHTTEGFLYEKFRYSETKQLRRKKVNPPTTLSYP